MPRVLDIELNSATDNPLVLVEDEGQWRPPSRTDQRGRGLALMHGLMDDVEIVPSGAGAGTRVTLRRRVAAR